jgi:hypothetical protein
MSETSAERPAATMDELEDDDEPGVKYVSSSHPGMVAVRRRSKRRRRRTNSADVRSRQIRIGLLILIVGLIAFRLTGHSVHQFTNNALKQIFRPIYNLVVGVNFEIIALVIAAAVIIYLTPGVEDSVLRVFGIKRSANSRRR